ncbi:MAG: hypothetical protein WC688_03795 [Parachlamydiales bacterium]
MGVQNITHNPTNHSLDSKIQTVCLHVFCESCIKTNMTFEKVCKKAHYCPVCQKEYTILIPEDLMDQFSSITIPLGKI